VIRRIGRRAFMCNLAAVVAFFEDFCLPSASHAQQTALPRRIGILLVAFSPDSKEAEEFRQGLRDAGYAEGRDLVVEWRYAIGDYARVPKLATALVTSKVDVIVVDGTVAAQAVKRATRTIPIVMAVVGDPVGSGLVTNLAHPGENVTGLSLMTADLSTKRLQLLKETIPHLSRVTVIWNQDTPFHTDVVEDLKAAAPSMLIEPMFVSARTPEEFGPALSAAQRAHAQALYVIDDPFFFAHRVMMVKLASKLKLPAIYAQREFAEEGGLMSYGTKFGDLFRRSAGYVDKILKGTKPGDLPIEQPTQFEFVINLKAANMLGIRIRPSVLSRADRVIR
jgi:putative ABC transport system substrate-binding protein